MTKKMSLPYKKVNDKGAVPTRCSTSKFLLDLYSINVRNGLLNEPISIKFPSGSAISK